MHSEERYRKIFLNNTVVKTIATNKINKPVLEILNKEGAIDNKFWNNFASLTKAKSIPMTPFASGISKVALTPSKKAANKERLMGIKRKVNLASILFKKMRRRIKFKRLLMLLALSLPICPSAPIFYLYSFPSTNNLVGWPKLLESTATSTMIGF